MIIQDDNTRRVQWKLGKVESLIEGKDGAVRGAVVLKITTKHGRSILLRRPIQKLYPLEQFSRENENTIQESGQEGIQNTTPDETIEDNQRGNARPKRASALRAEQERRTLIKTKRL